MNFGWVRGSTAILLHVLHPGSILLAKFELCFPSFPKAAILRYWMKKGRKEQMNEEEKESGGLEQWHRGRALALYLVSTDLIPNTLKDPLNTVRSDS